MSSLVISSVGVGLKDHVSLPAYLHAEKNEEKEQTLVEVVRKRTLFCLEEEEEEEEESSSIGAASSSSSDKEGEGVGEEEEVESKNGEGAFGSLDSLQESLPIKRGLSNFFSGKSKSFASLSDAAAAANANANELAKPENPFNKRRRILMAYKARRASYGSLTYLHPPLLSSDHTVVPEGDEEEGERCGGDLLSLPPLPTHGNAFRSSFSLSDLRHV